MNSLQKSREFDHLCKYCIHNIVRGGGGFSVSIIEDWEVGYYRGLRRVYLNYSPYMGYGSGYGQGSAWYLHYPKNNVAPGLTRQEREDALDSFELLFMMLDRFGIRVTKVDVLGQKNRTDLLHFLSHERSNREMDDEMEHLWRQDAERDRIFKGLPTLLEELMKDILVFNKKVKAIDEKRYAKMCRGHLRLAEYDAALRETKSVTEKVLRYIPEVATFADKMAAYDVALAESYYRISGETIDDDYFRYGRVGHLDRGLSEFTHFYAGWYDTEDETITEMVERTFNNFYQDKCKDIEDCIREEMKEELKAIKSSNVDGAIRVILDFAKERARLACRNSITGAISHLSAVLGISKEEFKEKYKLH